jgi:curved DNA-binding protein CbpA
MTMSPHSKTIRTYYQTLGVDPGADTEAIKQAYRDQLKQWHPDKNAHRLEEAEEQTKILNQAYFVLRDAERRKQYDKILRYSRAEDFGLLLDEGRFWQTLQKASPALKGVLRRVKELYSLFVDSVKGRYELNPVTLGIIGGGLLYFVLPMDVVPDFIPYIGFFDDLAVLTMIMQPLEQELKTYRNWKKPNTQ